jgi:hypothetical protein
MENMEFQKVLFADGVEYRMLAKKPRCGMDSAIYGLIPHQS